MRVELARWLLALRSRRALRSAALSKTRCARTFDSKFFTNLFVMFTIKLYQRLHSHYLRRAANVLRGFASQPDTALPVETEESDNENKASYASEGVRRSLEDIVTMKNSVPRFVNSRYLKDYVPSRTSYSVKDFEHLITSEEVREKVETLLKVYEIYTFVPEEITAEDMSLLISEPGGLFSWLKFFRYMTNLQNRKRRRLISRERRRTEAEELEKPKLIHGLFDDDGKLTYGYFNNTFINLKHSAGTPQFSNLINAAAFGKPFVVDFSYDEFMTKKYQSTLAYQVHEIVSYNRALRDPFDIHFCNYQRNHFFANKFLGIYKAENEDEVLVTATPESYVDLFPHDNLVYLSPHAEEELIEYDHEAVYIIGAFVDQPHHVQHRHSFVNASKHGIRSQRLPLESTLDWGTGNKCLCLNHVAQIMMDLRQGADLQETLANHVPRRKRKTEEEAAEFKKRQAERRKKYKERDREASIEANNELRLQST